MLERDALTEPGVKGSKWTEEDDEPLEGRVYAFVKYEKDFPFGESPRAQFAQVQGPPKHKRRFSVDQPMTIELQKESVIGTLSYQRQFVMSSEGSFRVVPSQILQDEYVEAQWKLEKNKKSDRLSRGLKDNGRRLENLEWRVWFQHQQKLLQQRLKKVEEEERKRLKLLRKVEETERQRAAEEENKKLKATQTPIWQLAPGSLFSPFSGTPHVSPIFARPVPKSLSVVCISDTHGLHDRIPVNSLPPADVIIHAGDFTDTGTKNELHSFVMWFSSLPYKYKILVAGNHDVTLQPRFYEQQWQRFHRYHKQSVGDCRAIIDAFCEGEGCYYLEDESVVIEDVKFYGTPWQPAFCNWAFNLHCADDLREKWALIPHDVDVLISHSPPYGYGDDIGGKHVGCPDLMARVRAIKPLYHVFGHIHEGYGTYHEDSTVFMNASTCTKKYAPHNRALTFTIHKKRVCARAV